MRKTQMKRKTAETSITMELNIDGTGIANIDTGCGFLDHMLVLFAKHGRFDLNIKCVGDTYVDYHHSCEDIGIVLGQCFVEAVQDKKGIERYADLHLPMDEALILIALDISGRSMLVFDSPFNTEKIGDFDTELIKEFFLAFTREFEITLHINKLYGENSHHIAEGIFKGVARALNKATSVNEKYKDEIPSTKGIL